MKLVPSKCPLCGGSGNVLMRQTIDPELRKTAREMRAKGMTYRLIAKLLHIDHPQKVKSMIEANVRS